jgi:drug/metabolite transporter (DMT)-like permease
MQLFAGDSIALLAMCGFATYALNLKRLPREMGVLAALFVMAVFGTAMLLPFTCGKPLPFRRVGHRQEHPGILVLCYW